MRLVDSNWYFAYVAVVSAVLIIVVSLLLGDGVDWTLVALVTAGCVAGTMIGRWLRSRRA